MREKRNARGVAAGKPLKRDVYCGIILRYIISKQNGMAWAGLIWH